MKKLLTIVLVFNLTVVLSQKKHEIFFSKGELTFTDKDINANKFSLGTHYLNKTYKSFGFEGYLEYAQSNNLPNFLDKKDQLEAFVKSKTKANIVESTLWSSIRYLGLGTRVHYTFINNNNFFFSFFGGVGYHYSEAKVFFLNRFTYNQNTGQVIDFDSELLREKDSSFFTSVGLRFTYAIQKKYTVGILANYHAVLVNDANFSNILLLTNNYNLAFTIGKQF